MKTLIASAFLGLTLGTATICPAADQNDIAETRPTYQSVVYPVINSTKIRVNIAKEKTARVHVSLKNEAGETLASEQVGKGHASSAIRFDLSGLKDGVYTVEVSDGTTKQSKDVKIQTTTPTVERERFVAVN
ncbi:hypothetical protein ACFPMF_04360 [Larkinella bovis]|uniref:T9SS type A sorting domain-containing protein n=1 Tax=Larkinella bovis TaxID=683041 RepID=A0ABW0I7Z6_9BACT